MATAAVAVLGAVGSRNAVGRQIPAMFELLLRMGELDVGGGHWNPCSRAGQAAGTGSDGADVEVVVGTVENEDHGEDAFVVGCARGECAYDFDCAIGLAHGQRLRC